MTEVSREFNVNMGDQRIYEAASQLMIVTTGLLKEYEYPDQLILDCVTQRGVNRSDVTIGTLPERIPTFIATKSRPNLSPYDIHIDLPLPSRAKSRGANIANYTLQPPPNGAAGGIIEFNGNVKRSGHLHHPMTAATVINGLTLTLGELYGKNYPITGYKYCFMSINYDGAVNTVHRPRI